MWKVLVINYKRYGKIDVDTESLVIGEDNCIKELGLENSPIEKIDARYIGVLKFSSRGFRTIVEIVENAYKNFGIDKS